MLAAEFVAMISESKIGDAPPKSVPCCCATQVAPSRAWLGL
jgi:hypothetical protein